MRRLLFSLLVCLITLAAPAARAADEATAKRAFAEGTELYGEGEVEAALEKFRIAHEGTGSPNARLYVARCLKDLGRYAEAYREMKLTLDEASAKASSSRKYAKTRDAAAAQLALIEPEIGTVIIAVVGGDGDTVVTVDGEELPKDQLGVPLVFDPKVLELRAESPGKPAAKKTVDVEAGRTQTVTLEIKAPDTGGSGKGGKGGGKGTVEVEPSGMNGMQVAGVVLTVVGVAGMGLFGVMGAMTLDRRDTLEEECGGTNCLDPSYQDTIDEGETFKLVANIGFVAGAVGIAAGVTLLTVGFLTEEDEPMEDALVYVGPQGGFVGYTLHF